MKIVELTQGQVAFIDDEDFERVKNYKWQAYCANRTWYAVCWFNGKNLSMHRFILGQSEKEIDHINGNGLDNRRENLRIATHAENLRNQRKQEGKSSKYKGVHYYKRTGKWQAYIKINQKRIHLGFHKNEIDAALAYNKAAEIYFQEYARFNSTQGFARLDA